jgi:hypothetical protein
MKEKDSKFSLKKVWKKPTLTHMPIKNTKGGGVIVNPEDETYNPEGS